MLDPKQHAALIAFCDAKIESVKGEMDYEDARYDELPRITDRSMMSHDDTMRNLNGKLAKWERIRSDAEGLEVTDRRKVERRAANKAASFAISTLAVFAGIAVGIMTGVAVIFSDRDLVWSNAKGFWTQVFGG